MEFFTSVQINEHLYRITDFTGVHMYLAIGRDTAALIDTGCGFGDLQAYVRRFTDKPVIVLVTHGHLDHAMNTASFNAVYMSRLDIPVYLEHCQPEFRKSYVAQSPDYSEELLDSMVRPASTDHFFPVGDNMSFDLGDLHVRMFSCPGHTPGSLCALIEEDRILITGDACNALTFLFLPGCLSISEYRESLIQLQKKVDGKFDTVLFSHGLVDGQVTILNDAIELCDRILDGTAEGNQPMAFMDFSKGIIASPVDEQLFRKDGVLLNIVYVPNNVR